MKKLFALIFGGIVICSCESSSTEIGSDFFTDGALDFSFIDSSTVNLSTIQMEEMVTSGTSRMLLGTNHDKNLGKFTASPYFQVTPTGSPDLEKEDVIYNYLSIVLPLDHYSYYDTLLPLSLNVHRVIEPIKTDEGYFYSSDSFEIEDTPLGTITFKPRPHNDSLEIKLSDVLGKEIFEKIINGDDMDGTTFLKYLHGLAIIPDTATSASILGLATNPKLKLHYWNKRVTPMAEMHIEFNVENGNNTFFTNISCDRTNTLLAEIPITKGKLSSATTNDIAYLQAGGGLALRIDIPYLRNLKQLNNFYPTRALLEIYPVRKSFNTAAPLPTELIVFKADKRNAIYFESETPAYLINDIDLGRYTHYAFDATEFVKEQMALEQLNENALVFTTDKNTFPVSAERIYAAAPSYEYKTRLLIYFATINNEL
ncbi:DUF4270 family protein [Chryseolinea sp. H1M3-3]|uniref:DUF4270 family protein n=1 Tax=Chryseolinea sp. H1M3-3 TaxID=3034144 RepID=UPI0023EDA400|nr:DUF4270 family protein [Chryseolinea sp. H1M3-3]